MLIGRSVRPSLPYPSRTSLKIVAAVLGILVAGAPIILFNAWLKKQGDDETAITAAWALESAEIRLGQTHRGACRICPRAASIPAGRPTSKRCVRRRC